MSNMDYSRIVFAFMLAYTIMNGVSGPLIDRIGTRLGYAMCVAWWSAASILQAFTTSTVTLGATRFLLGMGEAGNWPAGIRVVAEWFPLKERSLASGIFNSGSSIGALVATPLVVFLSLRFGWRTAFVAVGLIGFSWLLLWLTCYETPQSGGHHKHEAVPVAKLLRMRFIRAFGLTKMLLDPVWYFYIFWFPEYLKNGRHFDLETIGKLGWIPFLGADLGNLVGGWFCGWLIGRGITVTVSRKGSVTIAALLMASAIPAVFVAKPAYSIALVSLAMAGYTAANAVLLSIPADVLPRSVLASTWGLCSMGSGFGGMAFALLTGWLIDRYSYVPAFLLFGILPALAVAVLWIGTESLDHMHGSD
jgi:ACS family hexuronate transporter-like MFS transporter